MIYSKIWICICAYFWSNVIINRKTRFDVILCQNIASKLECLQISGLFKELIILNSNFLTNLTSKWNNSNTWKLIPFNIEQSVDNKYYPEIKIRRSSYLNLEERCFVKQSIRSWLKGCLETVISPFPRFNCVLSSIEESREYQIEVYHI